MNYRLNPHQALKFVSSSAYHDVNESSIIDQRNFRLAGGFRFRSSTRCSEGCIFSYKTNCPNFTEIRTQGIQRIVVHIVSLFSYIPCIVKAFSSFCPQKCKTFPFYLEFPSARSAKKHSGITDNYVPKFSYDGILIREIVSSQRSHVEEDANRTHPARYIQARRSMLGIRSQ